MDMDSLVHGELRAVWDTLPSWDLDSVAETRERLDQERIQVNPDPAVVWDEVLAPGKPGDPGIRVKTFAPRVRTAGPTPGLLWIHGGGYVLGSADGADAVCQTLAREIPAVVAAVDYRLAPEHPFPAGLDDCYAALVWLARAAGSLGVSPKRIGVAGMSAGGGLAAAVTLLARDRGEVPVCFQMPLYPMLDDRNETPSSREILDARTWDRAKNLTAWKHYLGAEPGETDISAYAAPARAADLSRLPPTYTMVGSLDLFRDETMDYVARLAHAGVPVEFHLVPGGFHGFEWSVPDAEVSQRARDAYVNALRRGLAGHLA
ncbi:MAG: alpha/beta hydrolase [Clostridia bacterium]